MSDVINSIFGRPKNESAGSGGYAYGTVEPAPETDEVVAEETDSAPAAETLAETAEDEAVDGDQAEADSENDSDDSGDSDDESGDDAAEASESEEDVTGTDEEAVAEDTEEDDTDANAAEDVPAPVGEAEPAAEEPVAEPVAETVAAEPIAETEPVAEAAETEPVVASEPVVAAEPAAARPAAGSRGSTTIADGVVGKIVVRIAAQTEGVHSVAEDGITVELADEVAWVTIPVVVEFGHAVKALGEQIRVAVIDAVEQYLGLDVEVVDVHVTDIHFPEAD